MGDAKFSYFVQRAAASDEALWQNTEAGWGE